VADQTGIGDGTKKRPSALLLFAGLAALAVSAYGLIGPDTWESVADVQFGWIVVLIAIVVGLVLVVAPSRR
jgi:putative copper export protein